MSLALAERRPLMMNKCQLDLGGKIALDGVPFAEGEGRQPFQLDRVPERCPKCNADGRWLVLQGCEVSHPARVGGCGGTWYLVRHDMPRPLTASGALPASRPRRLHTCDERCGPIVGRLRGGESYPAIAETYHLTRQRIEQIAREHDVPLRRPGRRRA